MIQIPQNLYYRLEVFTGPPGSSAVRPKLGRVQSMLSIIGTGPLSLVQVSGLHDNILYPNASVWTQL